MKRAGRHLLIGIGILSVIVWAGDTLWSEEPAPKSPEEICAERYKRCQWVLRELFPAELRTDVNYFGVLADHKIITGYNLDSADRVGKNFRKIQLLLVEGYRFNEALFGKNPDPNVDEKRFEECLDDLNRLGNDLRLDIEGLGNNLPISSLWKKWGQEVPVAGPKTKRERDMIDEAVAPTVANRLALLVEHGLLTSDQMADTTSLGLMFLHAAHLRFRLDEEIKADNKEMVERDINALHILLDLIEQDEQKSRKILFNLPASKRWKEVWEK